jgi:hypothetical protein
MASKNSKTSQAKPPDNMREYQDIIHQGVGFLARFQRFTWDFTGIFLITLGLITLVALYLPELSGGTLIAFWRDLIRHGFGYGSILVAVASLLTGIMVLWIHASQSNAIRRGLPMSARKVPWGRIIALELAGFTALALLSVLGGRLVNRAE